MKTGQRVMIYLDPLTEQKPEDEAILMSKVTEDHDTETWRVVFVSDAFQTTRTIKKTV